MGVIVAFWCALFFHFIDMLFTVLFIDYKSKKFKDAWKIEYNYHRYFMKKFGTWQGGLLSFAISFTVFALLMDINLYAGNLWFIYFVCGMSLVPAWGNAVGYIFKRDMVLERIDEPKNIRIPVPVKRIVPKNEK